MTKFCTQMFSSRPSKQTIVKKCRTEAGEKPKPADLLPTCLFFRSANSYRPDFSLIQRPENFVSCILYFVVLRPANCSKNVPYNMCLTTCVCCVSFRKDTNGFFAYPVNDVIAPGYSSIITNPMDFSSMKLKIDIHAYTSLEEFRVSEVKQYYRC